MSKKTSDYSNCEGNDKIKQWIKSAEQGNPCAQFELGVCYAFGKGLKQDKIKAANWLRKAVAQGCTSAKETLEKLGETE